jgi:F-box and leucine-rich repeat protein GRR1
VASCSNTLETIRLGGLPRLSRSAIRIIGLHCSRLRQIKLGRFPTMDDDTVQLLAQRCPLLEQFEVSHVTNATFTNASLVYLAKACSNLTTVGVSHCKQVGDVAIQELANRCWRSLRNLKLAGLYKLTNASIEAVAAKCASLVVLELDGCENVSDSAITALAQGCPDLRVLTLRSLKLTTTCLVQVLQSQQLSQLQRLNMARLNAQVTDHVIGALAANCRAARRSSSLLLNTGPQSTSSSSGPGAAASLTQLNLSWCSRFSSTAFKNLAAAMGTALRSIDLTECKLTDDTIIALAESCPQLEVAILDACPKITDTSVIKLAGSCGASLRTLSLSGCYRVTDPGIGKLSRCAPQLRYLDLSWCYKLTNSSIVQLFRDAPRMQTLLLNGCRQLTDSAIDELIHRPDLQPALSRLDLECVTLVTRPTLWKLRTARPHLNVSTKGS